MSPSGRDPRAGHPDFAPSERVPKILGVPVTPRIEETPAPPSKKSMWPTKIAGMQEAKATVPVSLGFLGALLLGAYQMGSWRAADSEKVVAEMRELKTTMNETTRELREARNECKQETRSLSVIESKAGSIQAELVVLSSKLDRK